LITFCKFFEFAFYLYIIAFVIFLKTQEEYTSLYKKSKKRKVKKEIERKEDVFVLCF